MLKGITKKGELKDVIVNEDGSLNVGISGGQALETTNTSDKEVTLNASVLTVGTGNTVVSVNKKITSIMIANYSETADITLNIGTSKLQVGANLSLELPVNSEIENLSITSTEADTKIQLVVKGVE